MDLNSLRSAKWQFSKGTARLVNNLSTFITIKCGFSRSEVFFENRVFQINSEWFCTRNFSITEGEKLILEQRAKGFWRSNLEIQIGNRLYTGRAGMSRRLVVNYSDALGNVIVAYRKSAWAWRAPLEFNISSSPIEPQDLLLLLAAGYHTMRRMQQAGDASIVAIAAAGT